MAIIFGSSGNDIIADPAGTDRIAAQGGDDTIRIANGNFWAGEIIDCILYISISWMYLAMK